MKTKISNVIYYFSIIICVFMLIFLAYRKFFREKPEETAGNRRTPVVQAIEKVIPAVVNLRTSSYSLEQPDSSITGSGCIIDPSGLILTNLHVVSSADRINVTLSTGAVYQASLLIADAENDIAVLKLENPPIALPVIPLVRPWRLLLGETVIAVGNPYGLDGSITVGVLSGTNRSLANGAELLFSDFLQTDAAVFPGNSGGPLINLDGCMIGMNMAVKRDAPGISFAMPLQRIENVLAKYLLPERMMNLNFGIQPEVDQFGRILIAYVYPGSPADQAGIRKGMEIISFNGWVPKHELMELSRRLIRLQPDRKVELEVKELGKVTVIPRVFSSKDPGMVVFWKLGIEAETMDKEKAEALNFPQQSGVIVSGRSITGINDLQRGDVIVEWNGKPIRTLRELAFELETLPPGRKANAVLLRRRSGAAVGQPQKRSVQVIIY